jgi:small subunit ribosomal protein S20
MPAWEPKGPLVALPGSLEGISVANIKSQKKRNIQNAKRAERNKAVRSELKTRVKAAVRTWSSGEDADAAAKLAQQRLDKAAAKGIIHKNQAARRKSRLMKKLAAEQS